MTVLRQHTRPAHWAWLGAIGLFALMLRFPVAGIPLERDEGVYAYIAQRWMLGEVPYRNDYDIKPPGPYVVYALIERIVGTSPSAIHWGMQLYTLGTLALIFVLARRLSSSTGGLAAAAFAAFMTTDPSVLGNAANSEMLMILPLTAVLLAACYAAGRDALAWAFATGVLGGLALAFKQTALSNVIFSILFVAWYMRRRTLAILAMLLGLLTVPALFGAYFASQGAWDAFVDATIGHSWAYAGRMPLTSYPALLWGTLPDVLRSFWPLLLLAGVPFIAASVGSVVPTDAPTDPSMRRNTVWMLLWLGASFAGVVAGGYFRRHYYIALIPPLAVLAGMGVSRLADRLSAQLIRRAVAACLVIVPIGIGIVSNSWYYLPGDADAKSERLYLERLFAQSPAVGTFLAEQSTPEDPVFVLGSEPQILYYATRPSATRYIVVYPLMGPFPDVRQRQLDVMDAVQRAAPRFIVTVFLPSSFSAGPGTPSDIFGGTLDLINRSYRLAAVVGADPTGAADPVVSGEQADAAWLVAPVWYGGPSWCTLAVWERVPSVADADRAAAEAESAAGVALAAKGDTEGAIAHYRDAIRLDPNFGAAHNNLAATFAKAGRLEDAIAQYVEAIRLSPLRAEPHWNLGGVLQAAGRLQEAVPHLRAAVFFNPQAEMRYRLAIAYAQAGQAGEAQIELEQVLREHPDSNAAEAKLAWLLATANDARLRSGRRAVQLAEDAAQRTQHGDANVLNSLAAAYAEVGRYSEAANVAAQAIEVATSNQTELRDALPERLARYRTGQPVRDGPGAQAP